MCMTGLPRFYKITVVSIKLSNSITIRILLRYFPDYANGHSLALHLFLYLREKTRNCSKRSSGFGNPSGKTVVPDHDRSSGNLGISQPVFYKFIEVFLYRIAEQPVSTLICFLLMPWACSLNICLILLMNIVLLAMLILDLTSNISIYYQ